MQKSVTSLYTKKELSKTETNNNNKTFIIPSKKNKIVRNKFNQGGKRFVYRKAQSMMKQIKEDTNKWKDSEHLILLKCLCYPR